VAHRPEGGADPPDPVAAAAARRKRIIRPLDAPPAAAQSAPPDDRLQRVLRPLAPPEPARDGEGANGATPHHPAPPTRPAGGVIRPLAAPPAAGSGAGKPAVIRPLAPLPPTGAASAEARERREQRNARLAQILRPLEPQPTREAAPLSTTTHFAATPDTPPEMGPPDPLLRTMPLPTLEGDPPAEWIYCARCDTSARAALFFCPVCGAALPAAAGLYETLTREYEDMQSAERPKSELAPLLGDGRRGPNWQAHGLSNKGRVRRNNEDSLLADVLPGSGWLLIVADGMGGASAGEVASQQTTAILRELIENRIELDPDPATDHRPWLAQAIEQANSLLYRAQESNRQLRGMGTTATAGIVQGLCLELAHVGDSRCYRLPADGPLEQLTIDHAIVAHLIRLGQITAEEGRRHPLRNQLYRSVATAGTIEVDTTLHVLAPADKLLFCSDGLMLHVEDAEIEQVLRASATPQAACRRLVDLTLERGAADNVSVIVVMAG
jgi:PPM family protein phosphatase